MTPERLEQLRNGWQHNATTECIVEIDRLWTIEARLKDDGLAGRVAIVGGSACFSSPRNTIETYRVAVLGTL